ncbi:MAG TPA: peptidyl-prolyl cis-trans isomerase [Candidatus Angelobacter sp.]|nr:peptidyl-prolyl cis-trans isomerase [Candidatus Angelobacter sp.]
MALTSVLAYSQYPGPPKVTSPAATTPPPFASTSEVPPDAVVITIHGVCAPGKDATAENSDSCTTTITRQQFEAMLAVMNVTNQNYPPAALRGIAESYVQLMMLAEAGKKAGLDHDPRFAEMMEIARVRTMAEMYRHSLDEKFSMPSQEEIEAYYKENIGNYEQLKIDRVYIPLANSKKPQERASFQQKAYQKANELRERAAKGEDMGALQAEAYKSLDLASPPATDLGGKRKGSFPLALEKDIFALKPGEITKVETDVSGFSFYKVRSREPLPLEYVKAEITRHLYQKNMEAAMKIANSHVHSELNDQFFRPHTAAPVLPGMKPAPNGTATPAATRGSVNASSSNGAAPATNNAPNSQAPVTPK